MNVDARIDKNAVDGFSDRFNKLLDHSGIPKKNRVAHCAKRFGVVHNTFKGWCTADRTPKTYMALLSVVNELLKETAGIYNGDAVAAWLLAGDAVPSPFDHDGDTLKMVEIFREVVNIAKKKGIEFDTLDREARELILDRARGAVASNDGAVIEKDGQMKLNEGTTVLVGSLLDMANTLNKK